MKFQKAKLKNLISPIYNPRKISEEEMQKLKKSITEFGYVDPLIVNEVNNHIVGGNQRFRVLKELSKELEIDKIDVIYIHEEDPNREKALNIALNKISGEFDFNKLGEIFNEMAMDGFDINLTGFEDFEINLLIEHFDDDFEDIGNNDEYDDNDYFLPSEMHEEKATFDLVKDDVYKFRDFELKLNDDFVNDRTVITIYQNTVNIKFECYDDESLLEEFLDDNIELQGKLRTNLNRER